MKFVKVAVLMGSFVGDKVILPNTDLDPSKILQQPLY